MGVGDEDRTPTRCPNRAQKTRGIRAVSDQVLKLPVQFDDVEPRVSGPVVQAVEVERWRFAAHMRIEVLAGGRHADAARRRDHFGQTMVPQEVVEVQVDEGTVHVQQNGVDLGPLNHSPMV